METPNFTSEQRAEFIYLQRVNFDSTLAELGEVLGITRERVRQIERDYRRSHGLPVVHGKLRECATCAAKFFAHSRRQRFCGSVIRQNGCAWDNALAQRETEEYKQKMYEYRKKNYKYVPAKIYTKVCQNVICKKTFETMRVNQKYCGSFVKKNGCSYYNQVQHKRVNPKPRYCKRCSQELVGSVEGVVGRRGYKQYCGWVDRSKIGVGEGCTAIMYLWSLHRSKRAISERNLYKHLLNIKDPKLSVCQPRKEQLSAQ